MTSDNQESNYIFEPVAEKAPDPTEPPTTEAPTTEPPATETSTTEPATEPQPEKFRGDVDANGKLELPDVIMMQKYLLAAGSLNDAMQGDMNEDGELDVFDLALMKRELLRR